MSARSRSEDLESADLGEGGFSLVEVLVTMVLLAIASTTIMFVTTRSMETARYTQDRNVALDQLRLMTAAFTKDVRQGIQATAISQDAMTFDTYAGGVVERVTWRVTDGSDGQRVERVVDGATEVVYVVDLTSNAILSYFGQLDPAAVHRVRLSLATRPDERHPPIEVATVVEMRNAS